MPVFVSEIAPLKTFASASSVSVPFVAVNDELPLTSLMLVLVAWLTLPAAFTVSVPFATAMSPRVSARLFANDTLPAAFVVSDTLPLNAFRVLLRLIAPFVAWQLLGCVFCALVVLYLATKGILWLVGVIERRQLGRVDRVVAFELSDAPDVRVSRRQFLARATYTYAAAGAALSGYGIWSAYRLPEVTRRTLTFPSLPQAFDTRADDVFFSCHDDLASQLSGAARAKAHRSAQRQLFDWALIERRDDGACIDAGTIR